jgi:hypothetical protein
MGAPNIPTWYGMFFFFRERRHDDIKKLVIFKVKGFQPGTYLDLN